MRTLDLVFILCIVILLLVVASLRRDLNHNMNRYQMNSNYVSNLNECISKTTFHDWMFDSAGITDYLKERYPLMFKK